MEVMSLEENNYHKKIEYIVFIKIYCQSNNVMRIVETWME